MWSEIDILYRCFLAYNKNYIRYFVLAVYEKLSFSRPKALPMPAAEEKFRAERISIDMP